MRGASGRAAGPLVASLLLAAGASAGFAAGTSGFLRVGLSNDYPPFSTTAGGFGRELASRMAADLGLAGPLFVDFDWPTLESDLRAGAFDAALGGITWRADRATVGWMSDALAWGGPCVVASVPWPPERSVDLAVNRGGFLERWSREELVPRLAPVAVAVRTVDSNLRLPDLLREGEVEAFVTDSFEVFHFAPRAGPRAAVHCEPAAQRKVIWVSPRRMDLAPRIARWIEEHRDEVADLRLLHFGEDGGAGPSVERWNTVLDLVARRLAYMPDVAAWKRERGTAVEDPGREAVVLRSSRERAEALGLGGDAAEALFRFLIEWAKEIQHHAPAESTELDLESEIRPSLLALGDRILEALDAARTPRAPAARALRDRVGLRLEVLRPFDLLGAEGRTDRLLDLLAEVVEQSAQVN